MSASVQVNSNIHQMCNSNDVRDSQYGLTRELWFLLAWLAVPHRIYYGQHIACCVRSNSVAHNIATSHVHLNSKLCNNQNMVLPLKTATVVNTSLGMGCHVNAYSTGHHDRDIVKTTSFNDNKIIAENNIRNGKSISLRTRIAALDLNEPFRSKPFFSYEIPSSTKQKIISDSLHDSLQYLNQNRSLFRPNDFSLAINWDHFSVSRPAPITLSTLKMVLGYCLAWSWIAFS